MRVQSFTKAELGAFWNFWYFPLFSLGHHFQVHLGICRHALPTFCPVRMSRAICACVFASSLGATPALLRYAACLGERDWCRIKISLSKKGNFSKIPEFFWGLNVDQNHPKWKLIWFRKCKLWHYVWKIYDHPLRICLREIASWQEPKLGFCWQLWHCQTLGPFREPTVFS